MVKNKKIKKLFSVICTVLMTSYTGLFGCDTVLALKYDIETGTVTLDKPLHQIIITSTENCENEEYTNQLKQDFKLTDYWNFTYEKPMSATNVIQHVVSIDKIAQNTIDALKQYPETEDVIYSIDLTAKMDYNIQSYCLTPTALIRTNQLFLAAGPKKRLKQLMEKTPPTEGLDGQYVVCQLKTASYKQKTLYIKDSNKLLEKPKLPPSLPTAKTIKNTRTIMQEEIDQTNPAMSQTPSAKKEHNMGHKSEDTLKPTPKTVTNDHTIFSNTKKFVHENPKTSVGLGAAIVALGGTVIYTLEQLFTRQTKKSQAKNQVNQKYNQHVKNKV